MLSKQPLCWYGQGYNGGQMREVPFTVCGQGPHFFDVRPSMIKNILVIGHANIGDVCYDLVVINPLRRHFPQAHISFLTSSRSKNIVEGYGGLNQVLTFDKKSTDRGLRGRLRLLKTLIRGKFDFAVVLKRTSVHRFAGIPRAWKVSKDLGVGPSQKGRHRVESYLAFLQSHVVDAGKAVFDFSLSEEEKNFSEEFLAKEGVRAQDRLVGILPLAAWSLKSWPIERWNALAGILKNQHGIKVINLGKREDSPMGRRITQEISREIISADATTLRQAMALIKRCSFVIGPDSSLLHVASCMGIEAIGLYGPTSGEYFYPYAYRQNNVSTEKKLACMPCYPEFKSFPCRGKEGSGVCMEELQVEDVLKIVQKRLHS